MFRIQNYGKTFIEWKVCVPVRKTSNRSPDFYLHQLKWELVLETKWDESSNDDKLIMYFKKRCEGNMPAKCLLKSYVKDKQDKHLFMICKEITQPTTEIWSYTWRSFFYDYLNVEFSKNHLTFFFSFDFRISNLEEGIHLIETEDKSVQTSAHLDDHLCLENLSLDFQKLMEEGSNPDVQLKCGDSTIPAHRLILGARSEVFRAMLRSDMTEGREGCVKIVDMEPQGLELLVQYLYSGILPQLTADSACTLYAAGDKYSLKALRERCRDFLAENLTRENACRILVMADEHSDEDLKDRVVSYVLEEKIPNNDDEWTIFCDGHPKLAIEVFRRAYKQSICHKVQDF